MDKAVDKALDLLTILADKMGTTVEQMYPYFVRQQLVDGMIALVVSLILCVGSGVMAHRLYRKALLQKSRAEHLWASVFVFMMLSAVLGVVAATEVPRLLNPHYYAIIDILKAVKP